MARVTVEDCVTKIPNRFDLVMVAAQRSREISAGAPMTVDRDNDKNPVVALREIADATVSTEEIQESLVRGLQRHVEIDQPEDDGLDMMVGDAAVLGLEPVSLGARPAVSFPDEDAVMADRMGMRVRAGGTGFDDIDEAALADER